MSKKFPVSIPPPAPDVQSLLRTVQAMKSLLEIMVGDRDKNSLGVPRVYIQRTNPVGGTKGDIWVNTDTKAFSFFNGNTWEMIA